MENNTRTPGTPCLSTGTGKHRTKLARHATGSISMLLYFLNTAVMFPFFPVIGLLKLLPVARWRALCGLVLDRMATLWISVNNLNLKITKRIHWDVTGLEGLNPREWYLVIANHRSWADILILQKVFNRKIPFLKFFLKKELIWVPLMGIAWWALDFPFMKRYSGAFLKKFPHLKGKDIEITRKACEKFRHIPVSIMNFVEGTRFTHEKHRRQNSPFANLLRPKAGGMAFVLSAMGGEHMKKILDVSICYPDGIRSFWDFLCGGISRVRVHIEELPITAEHLGDYLNNERFREEFQEWVNRLWKEKDLRLSEMSV